ncbi:hypothetical protein SCAR479_04284 [Seiridium cardinale]|uniref:Carrier domain-containing protein n=1 Tax=Seiridium cardinale TaxID=138064 RepID=A0ABR2XYF0_9PEZI
MRCETEVTYLSRHFGTLDIELPQTFNDIKNHAKDLIQQLIRELFDEVFNISRPEDVEDTMSLAELGVDSLTSMHIVLYLRSHTGLPLELDTFVECHTLRDIERKFVVLLNSQILVEEVMGTKGFEDMPRWRRWRDPAVTLSILGAEISWTGVEQPCRATWRIEASLWHIGRQWLNSASPQYMAYVNGPGR